MLASSRRPRVSTSVKLRVSTSTVEFGAPGVDVRVPWLNRGYLTATGNSFAAPHITGLVARMLGEHPNLTVFQVKTMLYALARNANPA